MIVGFISVVIGAIAVSVETAVSGISGMSVGDLFVNMLGIHCLIGIAEGIISFALYEFVTGMAKKKERYGVFAMGYMAVITSGILSLFASANPDGLEWSLIRVIGEADIQATTGIHMFFERIQEATALFPDYAMKTVDTLLSSSVVGMIGCGLVFAFVIAMASTVKVCRVKNRK